VSNKKRRIDLFLIEIIIGKLNQKGHRYPNFILKTNFLKFASVILLPIKVQTFFCYMEQKCFNGFRLKFEKRIESEKALYPNIRKLFCADLSENCEKKSQKLTISKGLIFLKQHYSLELDRK